MRAVLMRLTALALGLLVALVLAEIVLRVFRLAPSEGASTVTAREFDRIPGLFGPGGERAFPVSTRRVS